jgi:urease accessory protein
MATGAPMATATDPVLILAQWFSPAYPVGAFAYSHGLETAIAAGRIAGPGDLQDWLTDILRHGAGRADALFLAAACRAKNTETLSEIDALNRAFQPSAERLMETDLQGAAFAEATNAIWGTALPRLTYPVAVGRAARLRDLPPDRTAQLYLQAFTPAIFPEMGEMGLLGVTIPEEYGGLGAGYVTYGLVAREVERVDSAAIGR